MKFLAPIQSFRARLLLLLALMLGLTLGIQYYFNLRQVRANARMIIEQEQAIMTGIALGIESLHSDQYLDEIIGGLREPLLNDKNVRVKNILVVDNDGNVIDSIIPEFNPRQREGETTRYVQFKDIQLLPLLRATGLDAVIARDTPDMIVAIVSAGRGSPVAPVPSKASTIQSAPPSCPGSKGRISNRALLSASSRTFAAGWPLAKSAAWAASL